MSATDIYNRLRAAPTHHPSSVELFDDVTLQAGDVVKVRSGNTLYDLPIYSQNLHWDGSAMTTLESTGNEKRKALPALRRREYAQSATTYKQGKTLGAGIGGLNNRVSIMENSAVIQNSDSIALAAGKFVVDQDGNLHIINGTGLYLGEGSTSYGVYTEGNLTSGAIIQKINGTSQSGSILANKLNVNATDVAAWGAYTNNTLTGGILVQKINDGSTTTQILGSRVDVKATDLATWGVYTDNTLTAGIIVNKINGGTVQIAASKVDLGNYATVNQLEAVKGDITKLTTARTTATSMRTLGLTVDNDLSLLGYTVDWSLCSIGSKTFNYLAKNGEAPTITYADLPHYHAISCSENNGVVTITQGAAQATAGSDSFNIAATNFFKNAVAAARNEMGVIVDKDNGRVVKSGKATTKSVVIGVTADEPTYNQTDHTYSFAAAAKAGDTVMQSATKTTGTEAYTAGVNSVALTTGEFSSNGTKTPPTGYSGFSSVKITVPTGYTGLTVSGRTISCDNSSTKTSATISAGTVYVSESSTDAGYNTMSASIYLDGDYIGTATGHARVSSTQYKVVVPTANVSIDGSSQTVNLLPQTVQLTYTPPTPAGTVHTWGTGYLYSRQQVSSDYGGYAVWRYSDDGGVPSDMAKDWGWTHMYSYERDRFYDEGYHHWYACTG